jgi:hypothetical protein
VETFKKLSYKNYIKTMYKKPKIKISSDRSFGLLFFFIFIILGVWPLISNNEVRVWSLILGLFFLIPSLLKPNLLRPLNLLWCRFGIFLGSIVAPIVMGAIFFLVVTPTGFLMKLIGRDLLKIKFNKETKSYWIQRKKSLSTMKDQF